MTRELITCRTLEEDNAYRESMQIDDTPLHAQRRVLIIQPTITIKVPDAECDCSSIVQMVFDLLARGEIGWASKGKPVVVGVADAWRAVQYYGPDDEDPEVTVEYHFANNYEDKLPPEEMAKARKEFAERRAKRDAERPPQVDIDYGELPVDNTLSGRAFEAQVEAAVDAAWQVGRAA